jgi:small subunit ribosomal protein S19
MAYEKQIDASGKKIIKYKGKLLEELQALEVRQFAQFVNSRKRRTLLRNFQVIEKFVKEAKEKQAKNKSIRTHDRDLIVVPAMVGMRINVYNGKTFVQMDVTTEMLGHAFGEFSITRTFPKHEKKGVGASKSSKVAAKK